MSNMNIGCPLPQFNGYTNLEFIAAGGFGIIFKSFKSDNPDRPFAIKLYSRFLEQQRLERACKASNSHHNLVSIHDVIYASTGTPALVMDFAEGGTLEEISEERGKFEPHEAAALMLCVAEGLKGLHNAGYVHRDLKPSNTVGPSSIRDDRLQSPPGGRA